MARFDSLKFDGGMGLENLVSDVRQLLNLGIPLITAMWDHQDGRIDSKELADKIIFLTDLLNERLNQTADALYRFYSSARREKPCISAATAGMQTFGGSSKNGLDSIKKIHGRVPDRWETRHLIWN